VHPYYAVGGRPSIDPELMIRMLLVGYAFAIRSYRWFFGIMMHDGDDLSRLQQGFAADRQAATPGY
jgi:transposase